MKKEYLPLLGVLVSLALFALAAARYPGGYDWIHHFISTIFQPTALNGEVNPARQPAMLAVLLLCTSVGVAYWRISRSVDSRVHKSLIEIGGIGSAVYSLLVVTPMHDLMVSIGLLFSLTALVATTHMLYVERRRLLSGWGATCIALSLATATMYYGNVFYGLLPVVQKVGLVACIGWILAVYYAKTGRARVDKPGSP